MKEQGRQELNMASQLIDGCTEQAAVLTVQRQEVVSVATNVVYRRTRFKTKN